MEGGSKTLTFKILGIHGEINSSGGTEGMLGAGGGSEYFTMEGVEEAGEGSGMFQ